MAACDDKPVAWLAKAAVDLIERGEFARGALYALTAEFHAKGFATAEKLSPKDAKRAKALREAMHAVRMICSNPRKKAARRAPDKRDLIVACLMASDASIRHFGMSRAAADDVVVKVAAPVASAIAERSGRALKWPPARGLKDHRRRHPGKWGLVDIVDAFDSLFALGMGAESDEVSQLDHLAERWRAVEKHVRKWRPR